MSTSGNDGDGRSCATDEPKRKKLRSCEPDLKVICGGGDDKDNDNIRWHFSAILASRSKYIDTMLASPMRESQTRELSFPDVDSETWDLMMKFLEEPMQVLQMTVKDVMGVARYYDKYDFTEGQKLCEKILVNFIPKTKENEAKQPPDIDMVIDATVLASEVNLEKAKEEGIEYLNLKLQSTRVPYGRTMFTKHHISKIIPLVLEDDSMYKVIKCFGSWTRDSISKPNFPEEFVRACSNCLRQNILEGIVGQLRLSRTRCKADGDYHDEGLGSYVCAGGRTVTWGGVQVKFLIEKTDDGWAILRETLPEVTDEGEEDYDSVVTTACWVSPYSVNLPLPPKKNWRPVDPLARGNPEIQHICNGAVNFLD